MKGYLKTQITNANSKMLLKIVIGKMIELQNKIEVLEKFKLDIEAKRKTTKKETEVNTTKSDEPSKV